MDYSSSPLDAGASTAGLNLTSIDAGYLRTAGKWGRFIAIVGFVAMGFAILSVFLSGGMMALGGLSELGGAGVAGLGIFFFLIYGVFFAIGIYILIQLYRFSTNAIQAVDRMDQAAMTMSFQALARIFKIYGIFMVIYLGFIAIGILAFVVTGAAALI